MAIMLVQDVSDAGTHCQIIIEKNNGITASILIFGLSNKRKDINNVNVGTPQTTFQLLEPFNHAIVWNSRTAQTSVSY